MKETILGQIESCRKDLDEFQKRFDRKLFAEPSEVSKRELHAGLAKILLAMHKLWKHGPMSAAADAAYPGD